MKIINFLPTALILAAALTASLATAQNDTAVLTSGNLADASSSATSSKVIGFPPAGSKADFNTQLLTVDDQNQTIKLNYLMPSFTYSAVLLIQDFTGHTLKTFKVNPHNAAADEFYINDLLSGTYDYTLILDNQQKLFGKLIVKDSEN